MSNNELLKYVGVRFRKFREGAGYSRNEAALLIGITPRTLASYERGEREISMERTIKMAEIYKTTFARLTNYKNVLTDEVAL